MPETPEQLYERAKDELRMPPLEEWETFPFEGEIRLRELQPPADGERSRQGEGGSGCHACNKTSDDLMWEDEHWQLTAIGPTGLPLVLILEPKEHYDIDTLPAELAAEMGPLRFAAIWDDILPPVPEEIWRDNIAVVRAELSPVSSSRR
jgi:hypothetical protein